MSRNSRNRP